MSVSVIARACIVSLSFVSSSLLSAAYADSAYIQQATGTSVTTQGNSVQITGGQQYTTTSPSGRTTVPVPELAAPQSSSNGTNFAKSITVGSSNTVSQFQTGVNEASVVSTFGKNDTVGVVQGSNNLSNVAVAGTGLNVAVLQPANSAPINMFIARLPNGTILIKR